MRYFSMMPVVAALLLPIAANTAPDSCSQPCLLSNAGQMPVFRENGFISTVPLGEIRKVLKGVDSISENVQPFVKYLLGSEDKYKPVRCASSVNSQNLCEVGILVTGIKEYNIVDVANPSSGSVKKIVCEFVMSEIIFGDGLAVDPQGAQVSYGIKWMVSVASTLPSLNGWDFRFSSTPDGINFRNNYPGENSSGSAVLALDGAQSAEKQLVAKFALRAKRTKAFHYDVNLEYKAPSGTKWKACDTVDPVIVNTD